MQAAQHFAGELKAWAEDMGAKAFGVADLEKLAGAFPGLLGRVPGGFRRAVVMGLRLQRAVLETIVDRPTPLYLHHYRQVNYQLDRMALLAADRLQQAGSRALPIPASQYVCRSVPEGHLSHKLLGWAAGIGFPGRSTLLVHPLYGARMRYVSVLTDMPLPADSPAEGDCGSCHACREACPAGAIGERREDFDLSACYGKLCEFARLPFIGQHICGLCVKACPGPER